MTALVSSFKNQFSFEQRFNESKRVTEKYPDKLPIICEKISSKDPSISKTKYLVAVDYKVAHFLHLLRTKLNIRPDQAIFLFVNGSTMVPSNVYLATIYDLYKDEDGFLYLNYGFENVFG